MGLALILVVPYLFAPPASAWKVAALLAAGVGTAHGILFWVLRRRREREYRARWDEVQALNRALEDQVETCTQQVRDAASRLTVAEQQERQRLAQLLHDELQQQLYSVQLKVGAIGAEEAPGSSNAISAQVEKALEWIDAAISTTRDLTADLSPPVRGEGLNDILEWLVTRMDVAHQFKVELHNDESFRVQSRDMQLLLYQVVRELLFNAVKHAETGRASVTLRKETRPGADAAEEGSAKAPRQLIIVEDEGVGFDVEEVQQGQQEGSGFGLFSVRERLHLVGGRLEIDSAPGRGTRATIAVPDSSDSFLRARTSAFATDSSCSEQ